MLKKIKFLHKNGKSVKNLYIKRLKKFIYNANWFNFYIEIQLYIR